MNEPLSALEVVCALMMLAFFAGVVWFEVDIGMGVHAARLRRKRQERIAALKAAKSPSAVLGHP